MRRSIYVVMAAALLCNLTGTAGAQKLFGRGRVVTPASSIERPGDAGVRAHTHLRMFEPEDGRPFAGPPFAGYGYESPQSLACVYGLVTKKAGCNPNNVTAISTGGNRAIGIVDAYHYPTALADLQKFSTQFGLKAPVLQVVFASGVKPPQDPSGGWELEEALDLQWAHAMAPAAKLILVEAASNSFADLLQAEQVASNLVVAAGGGQVSNSWGSSEFSGETAYDSHFTTAGVVYFASSGDSPGPSYPSTSPNVVSAGGTTISRNPTTLNFLYETPWQSAGDGVSAFEPRPHYQNAIQGIVGTKRGTPDLSFDANPETGVWVYATTPISGQTGWFIVGGTSLSSPALAGIINVSAKKLASTDAELTLIYGGIGNATFFNDITSGICGPYAGYATATGWDLCTGVGSPKGKLGK
jgi:subtilase family serine protease